MFKFFRIVAIIEAWMLNNIWIRGIFIRADEDPKQNPMNQPIPVTPKPSYLWDTPENARHSVRVICDEEGHTLEQKNTMCATVGGESGWMNYYPDGKPVTHKNLSLTTLQITSTDWGICQWNDRYHIGPGLDFPSVEYVLANPDMAVRKMARLWKLGESYRQWWCAYKNGSYKKFL